MLAKNYWWAGIRGPRRSQEFGVVVLITVHNPIPSALHKYKLDLYSIFDLLGVEYRESDFCGIEGRESQFAKVTKWLRHLNRSREAIEAHHLVLWPVLGMLDLSALRLLRGRVTLIVHDPAPVANQRGLGRGSYFIGRNCKGSDTTLVTHSRDAYDVLATRKLSSEIISLPVGLCTTRVIPVGQREQVVRVIGQYKPARDLEMLREIARWIADRRLPVRLEICGRGWPAVAGWVTRAKWYGEEELEAIIASSDAIVLPYTKYFQSHVGLRAIANLVPVVGPGRWLEDTLGQAWPGLRQFGGWGESVERVLDTDLGELIGAYDRVRAACIDSWKSFAMKTA